MGSAVNSTGKVQNLRVSVLAARVHGAKSGVLHLREVWDRRESSGLWEPTKRPELL